MAEEKIRILVATDPCEKCKIKPCQRKCMFAELYEKAPGITRLEAIKKIEKHLIASTIKFSTTPDVVAEIALNGLLEGE